MTPEAVARIEANAVRLALEIAKARELVTALDRAHTSAKVHLGALENEQRAMTAPDWTGKL